MTRTTRIRAKSTYFGLFAKILSIACFLPTGVSLFDTDGHFQHTGHHDLGRPIRRLQHCRGSMGRRRRRLQRLFQPERHGRRRRRICRWYACGTPRRRPVHQRGRWGLGATSSGNGDDGGDSEVVLSANALVAYGGGGGKSDNIPSGTVARAARAASRGHGPPPLTTAVGDGANLTAPTAPTPGCGAGGGAGQSANGKNAGNATSNCSMWAARAVAVPLDTAGPVAMAVPSTATA